MLITLPLYILRELCKAFAMSLLIYTFVFLVMFCGGVVSSGVTIATVIQIIPYLFPMMSRLVLPLSIITGILISYGRFSANNEFIAAQASGIHPFWLGVPALVIAFFSSIITIWLNADVMTGSVKKMERCILADRTNIINSKLKKPGSFSFKIPGSITFGICRLPAAWNPAGSKAVGIDFAVFKQPGAGQGEGEVWDANYPYPETRILAKDHNIDVTKDDQDNMIIVGDFRDAIETSKLGRNVASIQTMPQTSANFVHPNTGFNLMFDSRRLQYMGIDQLKLEWGKESERYQKSVEAEAAELKRDIPVALKTLRQEPTPEIAVALDMPAGEKASVEKLRVAWDAIGAGAGKGAAALAAMAGRLKKTRDNTEAVESRLIGINAEIQVKLVMSFACIFFAFFGIPLAMLGKRGSSALGFAIGGGFAFLFYMVITALHGAVRDETVSWYILWVPNLTVFLVSIFLWYRMTRQVA